MKLPKYFNEPATEAERAGINKAVKALQLEAREYRAAGRVDAARALRDVAWHLRCVADGEIWTYTFSWSTDEVRR